MELHTTTVEFYQTKYISLSCYFIAHAIARPINKNAQHDIVAERYKHAQMLSITKIKRYAVSSQTVLVVIVCFYDNNKGHLLF